MIALVQPKRKEHLTLLVFGEPGTGKSRLALSFRACVVVDAHGTLDSFAGKTDARILPTHDPAVIHELIAKLAKDTDGAQTFVLDGTSRVLDEIQASAPGSNGRYYAAVRKAFSELTDAGRALKMHVIFTARAKDSYANTGDIVNGYIVQPDDKIITGSIADVDRGLPYDVDVVLEMIADDTGSHRARVVSSHLSGVQIGTIIEDPTAEKLLALAKIEKPVAIDFDKIDEKHTRYGSNDHLQYLARKLNAALGRTGETALALPSLLTGFNLWDGKSPLPRKARETAVRRLIAELAHVKKSRPSTEHITNEQLVALLNERNKVVNPPVKRMLAYVRDVVGCKHVNAASDMKPEDRFNTKVKLEAEIASAAKAESDPHTLSAPAATNPPSQADAPTPSAATTGLASAASPTSLGSPQIVDLDPSEQLKPEQMQLMTATAETLASLPPKVIRRILERLAQKRSGPPALHRYADITFVQSQITKAQREIKARQSQANSQQAAA